MRVEGKIADDVDSGDVAGARVAEDSLVKDSVAEYSLVKDSLAKDSLTEEIIAAPSAAAVSWAGMVTAGRDRLTEWRLRVQAAFVVPERGRAMWRKLWFAEPAAATDEVKQFFTTPLDAALASFQAVLVITALFSTLINLLLFICPLYMLPDCDRVLTS